MSLIPEISFTEFKKMKAMDLQGHRSFQIISNGEYLCTVVIPTTDYVKMQTEYLALTSNTVLPKEKNTD